MQTHSSVAVILAAALAFPLNTSAQNGTLDIGFQSEVNGPIFAAAVQANGQVLIGGDFTSVNGVPRNRIARLNNDGNLDLSFNPELGADAPVNSVAIQNDGKVLIAGRFLNFNGTSCNRIARLDADGRLDTSFNVGSGANSDLFVVAVQTNGQVLIGGYFDSVNTSNRSKVARLNSDGSLDTSLETSAINGAVFCLAVQPDGRIFIGGTFYTIGGTPRPGIARLRSDGSLDISFYPESGFGDVRSLVLQDDGKVLFGGIGGNNRIARLNADGSLDTTFNPGSGANDIVMAAAVQSDGKAIIGGAFTTFNGTARRGVARLNPDGSLDATFVPGLAPTSQNLPWVFSVVVQDDGKTLFVGDFTSVNGVRRVRIARLSADVLSPAATLNLKMYAGLTIAGQTGVTYRLEYTSNLTNQTLWHTLTDLNLSNSPQFYLDTTSPFSSRRFYRAVTLP